MTRGRESFAILLTAALIAVLVSGCRFVRRPGELRTKTETVELGGAESVAVELNLRAGQLTIDGGADALMEAEFAYNIPDWEPTVSYDVSGDQGELTVEQPDIEELNLGETHNEWDLRFAEDVPLDVEVDLGAGMSTLNVADLSLTSLDIRAGAGDVTLDLDGEWADELDVSMEGGVGQATVYLPADVSVRAEVEGAIGEVDATGLSQEGGAYVNDAYEGGDPTLELAIRAGVGQVNLEVVE